VRFRRIGVGALALCFGLALVLLRGEPSVASDQGVFLTVAARLLDGDHLYTDVVDNKDPAFFYTYALAFGIGGWRGPFLLDAFWLGLAAVSFALLARELRAPRAAVIAGFLLYPLALTAGWYLTGMSMLAALVVSPLVPWLWLRRQFIAAGVVLAVVLLLKLNLAPVAAAPVIALLVLRLPDGPRRRAVARGTLGLGGTLLAAAIVLALRGELRGYFETIESNVHYASTRGDEDGVAGRTLEHVRVATDFFYLAGRWQLPLALLVLAGFCVAVVLAWRRRERWERATAGVAAAVLLASLGVIGLTAIWEHHLQLLAYPAACIAVTLVVVATSAVGPRLGTSLAAGLVVFALWSSLKSPGGLEVSRAWRTTPVSAGAIALERARTRFHADATRVPYMVFGSNSENGHAAFIGDELDLACRWFQLYPFNRPEQFDETIACAEDQDPALILVTLGFLETPADGSSWARFVARARSLLESRYELVEEEPPGFHVWKRKGSAA
jgi:hypothetical protein